MVKSDNVEDHVFMPGEKIGEAFVTEGQTEGGPDGDGYLIFPNKVQKFSQNIA